MLTTRRTPMSRGMTIACITALLISTDAGIAAADEVNTEGMFGVVRSLPMSRGVDPMTAPYLTKQDLTARQPTSRSQLTGPTAQEIAEAKNPTRQVYAVDSSKYSSAATPMADPSDPVLPQECVDHFMANDPPNRVWLKHRFASCHAEFVVVDFYQSGSTLPVGRAVADWAMTVNMSWNARSSLVTERLSRWRIAGSVNPSLNVGIEIGCFGVGITGSTARCKTPTWGWTKSIAAWRADGQVSHTFEYMGEDPADPNVPVEVNAEKRTLYSMTSYAYGYGGPGPWDHYGETQKVSFPFRCDIARSTNPNYAKSSDCVFHGATGWLRFDVKDPEVTESAQLIYDAHQDFDKVFPGGDGKYIPGNIGLPELSDRTEPLTRLFYDGRLRANNRSKSISTCKEKWGPDYTKRDDGKVNECDEFPFATTYEGAFTVTPNMLRTYAVRPVLREHNGAAGGRWGEFLAQDHLLDGDPAFVTAYK